MPTNDIKTIADGGTANVLSQAAYVALTTYLDTGFSSGIVPSNQINKTIRQSTLMAYVLAQHIVNLTGLDVLDNGDSATILANLTTAIRNTVTTAYAGNPNGHVAGVAATAGTVAPSIVWDITNQIFWVCTTTGNAAAAVWTPDKGGGSTTYCGLATGTANAIVLTPAVPVAAYSAGLSISFIVATTNTGATTVNVSGLGAVNLFKEGPTGPIALVGGELVAGNLVSARHDGTRLQLTATELGTAALANASSLTGTVAAVTGAAVVGNVPAYTDTTGTINAGRTPTAGSGDLVALQGAVTAGHLAVFDANGSVLDGGLPGVAGAATYLNFANGNGITLGIGNYNVDTATASGGAFSSLLPAAPAVGASLVFTDIAGTWNVNYFTLQRNGHTIEGIAEDFIFNVQGLVFGIEWNGTTWRLV